MNAWREAVERDGYGVRRALLNAAELDRLRSALRRHFERRWDWEGLGKHQPAAAVAIPEIGWVFSHPAIVAAFRELTGSPRPIFTGNCDAHMNMLSWWHKDTSEGSGGCFQGDYFGRAGLGVYRAGVYLQDHDTDGCGLRVRAGSHRTRSLDAGAEEVLRTRAGDVIFFDMRLTHAGQFADPFENLLLRLARKAGVPAAGYQVKQAWNALSRRRPKLSIFFTVGAPGPDTSHFCAFEAAALCRYRGGEPALLPSGLVQGLAAQDMDCNPLIAPA